MSDQQSNHSRSHDAAGVGHEGSELNVAPVVWFLIGLGVATILIGLLIAGMFSALQNREEKAAGAESALANERQKLPPEPRLQLAPSSLDQVDGSKPPNLKEDHPLAEMKRLREEAQAVLNSYGWVDEKGGIVRIPISQAKELLIKKGIPTRKQ